MARTETPGLGCWKSTYPSIVWLADDCGPAGPFVPPSVGAGTDYYANAGTSHIALAKGDFNSVSGLTSETDTTWGSKWYSLQINTNGFYCNPPGGTTNSWCWQQFVFQNNGTSVGQVQVWYVLPDYLRVWGNWNCPTNFTPYLYTCYWKAAHYNTPAENPITKLSSITFFGSSNHLSSGNDQTTMCDGSSCYSTTVSSQFSLSSHWTNTEFNVLGFGGGSTAIALIRGPPSA
jgi:hypothetical protein